MNKLVTCCSVRFADGSLGMIRDNAHRITESTESGPTEKYKY